MRSQRMSKIFDLSEGQLWTVVNYTIDPETRTGLYSLKTSLGNRGVMLSQQWCKYELEIGKDYFGYKGQDGEFVLEKEPPHQDKIT